MSFLIEIIHQCNPRSCLQASNAWCTRGINQVVYLFLSPGNLWFEEKSLTGVHNQAWNLQLDLTNKLMRNLTTSMSHQRL